MLFDRFSVLGKNGMNVYAFFFPYEIPNFQDRLQLSHTGKIRNLKKWLLEGDSFEIRFGKRSSAIYYKVLEQLQYCGRLRENDDLDMWKPSYGRKEQEFIQVYENFENS